MGPRSSSYLLHIVRDTVAREKLIDPGETILVGFSGGADSLCLLAALCALRESLQIQVSAFHVHHGLRESADRDETFCRRFCKENQIPLTVFHVDAKARAREEHRSVEEAGRILRQECAAKLAKEIGADKIALAHHMEDRAETFLFHAARGSALTGLRSILPKSGMIIRPLIAVSRDEIEAFLRENGLGWCTDETNADDAYTRNRIRHQVLPILETEVNAKAAEHICAAAEEIAAAESFLEKLTAEALLSVKDANGNIIAAALAEKDPYLQGRILYLALGEAARAKKDITGEHIRALRDLIAKGGSHSLDLPYGICAEIAYGHLTFTAKESDGSEAYPKSSEAYEYRVFLRPEGACIPKDKYTKWFDYDKMCSVFSLRKREEGDYMTLAPGRKKSLSRFMIDEKIPAKQRADMVLPVSGKEVLWVPGHRISAAFLVDENTVQVLEITCKSR